MSFDPNTSDNRHINNPIAGSIAFVGGLAAAMFFLQNNITDYKTISSHIQEAAILSPTAPVQSGLRYAIISGELEKSGNVIEPLTQTEVSGIAAMWVKEERYRRQRKSSRWRTVSTTYAEAPNPRIGNYALTPNFIQEHGSPVQTSLPLEGQTFARSLLQRPGYTISGRYLYTDSYSLGGGFGSNGNHRYSYSIIRANQTVTIIGEVKAAANGRGATILPSPGLSGSSPAIWLGTLSPEQILESFKSRMINTLMGIGGIILLLSWAAMALINNLSRSVRKMNTIGTFAAAFVGSAASVATFYALPNFLIATPLALALYIISFFAIRPLFQPTLP